MWIRLIKNVQQWLDVADYMFKDGIVNEGRLEVLHYFTDRVVENLRMSRREQDASEIWQAYKSYKIEISTL